MRTLLLFAFLLIGFEDAAQATLDQVLADTIVRTGYVRTKKGNPISGVRIQSNGGGPIFTTDQAGRFEIRMPHEYLQYAVWFQKKRFRRRLIPLVSIEPEVWMYYEERVKFQKPVTL